MRIKTKLLLIDICSKSITCTKDQDVDINSNLWIKCYLGHDTRRSHRWYSCNRRNSQIDSPTHSRKTFESVGESDCNRGSRETVSVAKRAIIGPYSKVYLAKSCSQVSVERTAQVSWSSSQAPVHTFHIRTFGGIFLDKTLVPTPPPPTPSREFPYIKCK